MFLICKFLQPVSCTWSNEEHLQAIERTTNRVRIFIERYGTKLSLVSRHDVRAGFDKPSASRLLSFAGSYVSELRRSGDISTGCLGLGFRRSSTFVSLHRVSCSMYCRKSLGCDAYLHSVPPSVPNIRRENSTAARVSAKRTPNEAMSLIIFFGIGRLHDSNAQRTM